MPTRQEGSPYVQPPSDLAREMWQADIERIRETPEASLPRREYQLGPGDVIALNVIGRPDLLGANQESADNRVHITISESPFIVLPYIGSMRVHGKSPEQLQEDLTAAYSRIVRENLNVVVTVERYFWNQMTVIGSVRNPGRYTVEPGDTLLDAIFKAGGLTLGGGSGGLPPARTLKLFRETNPDRRYTDASLEELLERIRRDGTLIPREEIHVPLDTFLLGGNLEYNLTVLPNDVVYIPAAGTVTVHGPVRNARVVFLGPGIRSFSQVMTETGGLQFKAASTVEIVRPRMDGETDSIYVNARRIMRRADPDVMVEDNDQIFVYLHGRRNVLNIIGSIFRTTASAGVNATYSPVN